MPDNDTVEQHDAATAILTAMSKMSGYSYFPDAPENDNSDFKAGYQRGLQGEPNECLEGITTEWKRRGSPTTVDDSFTTWKRGYWAGRYTRISEGTSDA